MTDQLLWYTTRAAGAVSLVLLTAVVILGVLSALRFKTAGWPALPDRPGFTATSPS